MTINLAIFAQNLNTCTESNMPVCSNLWGHATQLEITLKIISKRGKNAEIYCSVMRVYRLFLLSDLISKDSIVYDCGSPFLSLHSFVVVHIGWIHFSVHCFFSLFSCVIKEFIYCVHFVECQFFTVTISLLFFDTELTTIAIKWNGIQSWQPPLDCSIKISTTTINRFVLRTQTGHNRMAK